MYLSCCRLKQIVEIARWRREQSKQTEIDDEGFELNCSERPAGDRQLRYPLHDIFPSEDPDTGKDDENEDDMSSKD